MFNQFNPFMQVPSQQPQMSNPLMFMRQFNQFAQQYRGMDPRMVIQQMLNNGTMTQEQFNQLRAMANQLTGRKF